MKFIRGIPNVRPTIRSVMCATAISTILLAGAAQAQQVAQADIETERAAERLRKQQERISAMGGGGADGFGPLLREVTFKEVLADPDNVELNILYARTQIKHGRMDKAQATLERILLVEPDLVMVKMLYGLVLFRLDNMGEAEVIFNDLLAADITANDRAVVQAYLDQIAKGKKRLSVKLTVSAGIHYDDNRTASPRSGSLSLFNNVLDLGIDEKADWGALVNLGGEARYDLGYQRPHYAYGKAALVLDEQRDENNYDLIMGRADLGVSMAYDIGRVDFSVNHALINLGHAAYMETPGAKVRWDAYPNTTYVPYAEVSASHQLYRSQDGGNSNAERNGY